MAEQKRPIGYPTPSKEIQDAFKAIKEDLLKRKSNWEGIHSKATELFFRTLALKEYSLKDLFAFTSIILVEISKIGIELTETHERLAKVEKAIQELQRMK